MKKIVFWGSGKIGVWCLGQHADIVPLFLIDSFSEQKMVCGKEVKHPDEIEDWTLYYIVITTKKYQEIETILQGKGLHKNSDYSWYQDFFSCHRPRIEENMDLIRMYAKQCDGALRPIMLVIPTANMRNQKSFFTFLKEYIRRRKPRKVVVFTQLEVISREKFAQKFDCQVINMPDIFGRDKLEYEMDFPFADNLSARECEWLEHLGKRKVSSNEQESLKYSEALYCYYRAVIIVLKPCKILIWGNWTRESYILGHLADIYGIKHGYMEHGWIPGTTQFDPQGIAGQGIYAVKPDVLDEIVITQKEIMEIQKIKRYVIEKQLDTRVFRKTEADEKELKKIDSPKKTIFLIGMDEAGMGMNHQDSYWKRYISNVYESVQEVLIDLIKICDSNNLNLIFKPHPGNKIQNIPGDDLNKVVYVKDASIDELIQISDVMVSIASAVDYKVLMYGKPLIQVGETGLKGKGCSYEVTSRGHMESAVLNALVAGMTAEQIRNYDQFLAKLLKRYLWDDMSEKEIAYGLTLDTDFGEEEAYECNSVCTD